MYIMKERGGKGNEMKEWVKREEKIDNRHRTSRELATIKSTMSYPCPWKNKQCMYMYTIHPTKHQTEL